MQFRPVKQISTILKQQYFEPTISWSLRVVLALNVPLIVIPLFKGLSYEVIWSAFGAYMLSLIDYRGLHYKKIILQALTSALIFCSSLAGMYLGHSLLGSVLGMLVIGLIMAILRNWNDYGPSIAVSLGFFFLLGLASPLPLEQAMTNTLYLLLGCAWAILITFLSFPFQPSNPVRRSVAKIWKANTDLLDAMVQKLVDDKTVALSAITEKELAVRKAIDQSRDLFLPRQKSARITTRHYDQVIELRKTASLFAASLSSLHEELEVINTREMSIQPDASFYKTLSAFAQASARLSIVIFTFRPGHLSLAKIRVKRCEVAVELFTASALQFKGTEKEQAALRHFTSTLQLALSYMQQSLVQVEEKMNLKESDYFESYKLSFHEFVSGLTPGALGGAVSGMFQVNRGQINYALRVAIGLAFGIFLYKFFKIDHGYWIALTMMIVIQPYYGATLKKGIERMIGTVAGIILGGLILLLPIPHETIVVLLAIDSFFVAYFLRNNYKVGVFFVTIMMVLLMQVSQQGSWQLIGWRIVSTLIGAVLALVAGYAFWPVWEHDRFPALMVKALERNKNYLQQLIRFMRKDMDPADSWYKYRRLAEGANGGAFTSGQRMLEEPKYIQQQAELSLALVGANVRITREITSMALSVEKQPVAVTQAMMDIYAQTADVFDHIAAAMTGKSSGNKPDLQMLKGLLNAPFLLESEQLRFIKTELEKIIFELEAMLVLINQSLFD